MPFRLDSREITHTCELHGEMQITQMKIYRDWIPVRCPSCEDERKEREKPVVREITAEERERLRLQRLQSMIEGSGLPERFQSKRFSSYVAPTPTAQKVLQQCQIYAANFSELAKTGTSLILCGQAGTGKTHLASAIAVDVMEKHGKSVRFLKVARAMRTVKDTYSKSSAITEQEAIESFKAPDLLILDEVGVQFGTDAERYILFEIINERYESLRPTILLSNLAMEGLVSYAGERVIDRMKENGGMMLVFDWKSHRGSAA